jgi:FtsZ-binding cell division protein ZapB
MKKQKKTGLELLNEKSKNAINVVLQTIEDLKNTNNAIDEEYQKNSITIENIQATNKSLDELKNSNSKIIFNFEALLN